MTLPVCEPAYRTVRRRPHPPTAAVRELRPRVDNARTVDASELTGRERNARAATSVDDIDLEL